MGYIREVVGMPDQYKLPPEAAARMGAYIGEMSQAAAQLAEDVISAAIMMGLTPETTVYRTHQRPTLSDPGRVHFSQHFAGIMVSDKSAPEHAALWAPHEVEALADEIADRLDIQVEWVSSSCIAIAARRGRPGAACAEVVYANTMTRSDPLFACRLAIIRAAAALYRAKIHCTRSKPGQDSPLPTEGSVMA